MKKVLFWMNLLFSLCTLISTSAHADIFNYSLKPEPSFRIPGQEVFGLTNISYEGSPILTISPEDKFKLAPDLAATEIQKNFGFLCEKMGFKQNVSGGGISIKAMNISLPARFAMVQNGQVVIAIVSEQNLMGDKLSVITGLACAK